MIVRNIIYNSTPIVIHAQGKEQFCPLWRDILLAWSRSLPAPASSVEDLSIITWNNGHVNRKLYTYESKWLGCFEESCQRLGLTPHVLGQGVASWENRIKLRLITDFLRSCTTKYVLGCDSADVIITGKPDLAIAALTRSGAKLLFNAEILQWPPGHVSNVAEDRIGKVPFKYLNGGVWVGDREFCLKFFEYCLTMPRSSSNPHSEQVYLKYAYVDMYPEVQCDWDCSVFQTLNRVDASMLEVIWPETQGQQVP